MQWSGKLVGGAVGMLVGGPVGAALGVLAGHLVDDKVAGSQGDGSAAGKTPPSQSASSAPTAPSSKPRAQSFHHVEDGDPFAQEQGAAESAAMADAPQQVGERFFDTTFEVMGHVAKCDGRVSEQDIRAARAVMQDFQLDATQTARAIERFNLGKQSGYDISRAVMALRRACAGRPDMLGTFLEIQIRAAIGGSDLRGPARPLLTKVAAMLGVAGLEFAHLEAALRIRYRARGNRGDAADWNRPGSGRTTDEPRDPSSGAGADSARKTRRGAEQQRARSSGGARPATAARMSLAEAYEVLGLPASAGPAELSKAYRRQLSRNHPDKLKANGLPESMLAHAQQRTQQIIEAWNVIRENRGIKS